MYCNIATYYLSCVPCWKDLIQNKDHEAFNLKNQCFSYLLFDDHVVDVIKITYFHSLRFYLSIQSRKPVSEFCPCLIEVSQGWNLQKHRRWHFWFEGGGFLGYPGLCIHSNSFTRSYWKKKKLKLLNKWTMINVYFSISEFML